MNIGIIVYSQTGNTLSVAEKIKEKLAAHGHKVAIERIEIEGQPTARDPQIRIKSAPGVAPYDALVFGAPVQAFHLCAAMQAYMDQLPALNGKKVAVFITKGLKGAWTGGNGAIKKLKESCEGKGGQVGGTGMVFWADKNREQSIESLAEEIAKTF